MSWVKLEWLTTIGLTLAWLGGCDKATDHMGGEGTAGSTSDIPGAYTENVIPCPANPANCACSFPEFPTYCLSAEGWTCVCMGGWRCWDGRGYNSSSGVAGGRMVDLALCKNTIGQAGATSVFARGGSTGVGGGAGSAGMNGGGGAAGALVGAGSAGAGAGGGD
jgi:hypothetical protein